MTSNSASLLASADFLEQAPISNYGGSPGSQGIVGYDKVKPVWNPLPFTRNVSDIFRGEENHDPRDIVMARKEGTRVVNWLEKGITWEERMVRATNNRSLDPSATISTRVCFAHIYSAR